VLNALGISSLLANRAVTELSVGQQQRVAAARALVGHPELIIADEPTSALDSNTRDHYLSLLFEQCRRHESSLLFVSHDLNLANQFDRTINVDEIIHWSADQEASTI
jgi:putative ABC transport system ATP-binding protein